MVYTNQNGKRSTFELEPVTGRVLKEILESREILSEELRIRVGLDAKEFAECLDVLRIKDVIKEIDASLVRGSGISRSQRVRSSTRPETGEKPSNPSKRIDRYTFQLCDISQVKWLADSRITSFFRSNSSALLITSFALAVFTLWSFYSSPNRALGSRIVDDLFRDTSIIEVFSIVLISQALTIIYKVCVGLGKEYSSSILYVKFMAGFHPVFEAGIDKPYSMLKTTSKWEYFTYVAAPQVMRAYLLALSILLVYLGYPFATTFAQFALKLLLINISISIITFFWAMFPSPGTASYKALEIYNIIPARLVGVSIKKVFSDIPSQQNSRYKFALIVIAALIATKIIYLLVFLLPELIYDLPAVFGTWTPQIAYVILVVMAVRFIIFKYGSQSNGGISSSDQDKIIKKSVRPLNELDSRSSTASLFERLDIKSFWNGKVNKKVISIVAIILICPYISSVSGSAKIVETMSLDIISTEKESSIVKTIYKGGPSSNTNKKGEEILLLQSPSLESLISQSKDRIDSLEKSGSILKTELSALKKGSKYETSKNADETVAQNVADIGRLKYEVASLEKQVEILQGQTRKYKELASSGALSDIQYEDKVLEMELKLTNLRDTRTELKKMESELIRSKRSQRIDQSLTIPEEISTTSDKLKSNLSDLNKERKELAELQRRKRELRIVAPFDCVIDSDTSLLMGKQISYGDKLLSLRSVPSEEVLISVAEYDRGEISLHDSVEVRLYSKINAILYGKVKSVSPITTESHDQEIVDVYISLDEKIPSNFIGASGTGKIRTGWTCLLWNLIKPIVRFIHVDLWSVFP